MGREKGRTNCRRHYSPINCSTSHKFSFRFINRHNGPHMHRLLYLKFDFPQNIFIFNCLLLAVATHKRGVWTNSRIWSNRKLWTNRFTGDSIFELVRPSALYSGVAFSVERLSSLLCEWFICFNCFHNIWGIKYTNIEQSHWVVYLQLVDTRHTIIYILQSVPHTPHSPSIPSLNQWIIRYSNRKLPNAISYLCPYSIAISLTHNDTAVIPMRWK